MQVGECNPGHGLGKCNPGYGRGAGGGGCGKEREASTRAKEESALGKGHNKLGGGRGGGWQGGGGNWQTLHRSSQHTLAAVAMATCCCTCPSDADQGVLLSPKLAKGHGIHWRLTRSDGHQVLLIVHPDFTCKHRLCICSHWNW